MKVKKIEKRAVSLLLILALLFSLLGNTLTVSALDADTDGTYLIGTASEFMEFIDLVNGGQTGINAALTADIDLTDAYETWTAIGSNGAYTGTFDGAGHTVSGITSTTYGLFKKVDGTVKNVILSDSSINSTSMKAGAIVGTTDNGATILNCGVAESVTLSMKGAMSGGLAGQMNSSKIINCWVAVEDIALMSSAFGAILGMGDTEVINCFYYGSNGTSSSGTKTAVYARADAADHANGAYTAAEFADGTVLKALSSYNDSEITVDYALYGWQQGEKYPIFDTTKRLTPDEGGEDSDPDAYKPIYSEGESVVIGDFTYTVLTADTETEKAVFKLTKFNGSDVSITVENGDKYEVTEIASNFAFGNKTLTSVTLPDTVTTIGEMAFWNCTALTEINLPQQLVTIGDNAFGLAGLHGSLVIPGSVKTIGTGAFSCSGITSVTIPEGVEAVGSSAFGAAKLTTLHIPSSVIKLGAQSVRLCTAGTFTGYTVAEGNPNYKAVDGVLFSKDGTVLYSYPTGKVNTSYSIPETVTTLGSYSFISVVKLKQLTIPASVTEWKEYTIYSCPGLTEVVLSDGLTSLGAYAIYLCANLTEITVPESVAEIGTQAVGYVSGGVCDGFCISGYSGSQAHLYAMANGIDFKALGVSESEAPEVVDGYYLLKDEMDLVWFRDMVNSNSAYRGLKAKLTADIELTNTKEWEPIGKFGTDQSTAGYAGVFDGAGYTISNLSITKAEAYRGLFGYTINAEIKNLTVSGTYSMAATYVGGIVGGSRNTTISNCTNQVKILNTSLYTGGIAGDVSYTTIENCQNVVAVTGTIWTAGIAGRAQSDSIITRCSNSAVISGSSFVGGIVGLLGGSSVSDVSYCYNLGFIDSNTRAAGIAGSIGTEGRIVNSYSVGKAVNGIAGAVTEGKEDHVTNSFYKTSSAAAGLADKDYEGTVALKAVQFRSGEAAYLLNAGDETGSYWVQGENAVPVLGTVSSLPYEVKMYYQQAGGAQVFYVNAYTDAAGHIALSELNPGINFFDVEKFCVMDGATVTGVAFTETTVVTQNMSVCAVLAYSEGKVYEDEDVYEPDVVVDKYADYETDVTSMEAWTDHYGQWVMQSDGSEIDTMVAYATLRFDKAVKLAPGKTLNDLKSELAVCLGSYGVETDDREWEIALGEDGKSLNLTVYIGYAIYGGHLIVWPLDEAAGISSLVFADSGKAVNLKADLIVPNGLYTEIVSQTIGTETTPASLTVKLCASNEEKNHTTRAMIHMAFLSNGQSALGELSKIGSNLTGHWHDYRNLTPEDYWKLEYVPELDKYGYHVSYDGDEMTITALKATSGEVLDFHIVSYLNNGKAKIDKTELLTWISLAEGANTADANSALAAELREALAVAKVVSESPYYAQSDVDAVTARLKRASEALGIGEDPCAVGHMLDYKNYTVTKQATTAEKGIAVYTCTRCGKKISRELSLNPFTDVKLTKDTEWYYLPVLWAVERSVTTGTTETTFSPDAACTRAQAVTFLWRAANSPEPTSTNNPFMDVSADQYYYKAVLWAVEKGITNGISKTEFSPNTTCNRAQIVTFLYRYEGKPAARGNGFNDVPASEYYYAPVIWAVSKGVTNGMGDGNFSPLNNCTRGQIVTFLYRDLAK